MEFRRLAPSDADVLLELAALCAHGLTERHGPGQWSVVRGLSTYRQYCAEKLVFAAMLGELPLVTFTLGSTKPSFIPDRCFTPPIDPYVWMTNFFVHPLHQRQGYGRQAFAAALVEAARLGARWLRFDSYHGPAGASPFYVKCGCRQIDEIIVQDVHLDIFEAAVPAAG